ncbi:MAG: TPM domain-containing protein [Lachnospiraceae bacterium]|nr:TPM domain-containing protein [Lachnospiraceae bacterium]MDD3659395.1 TPM domain-containing protein [Lachnospiraceae bacterium]
MVKKYLSHFKYFFIVIGIVLTVTIIAMIIKSFTTSEYPDRSNLETDTNERVFDYADKLTDAQENSLRELILQKQKQTGCDIILVTLEESLEEYALSYENILGTLSVDQYVMVYADNFYDEHKFGYDQAYGDGAIYVDNWGRERDGYRYTWFGTSGRAEATYSDGMIDNLIERVIDRTNEDPYQAYVTYVNQFSEDMDSGFSFNYDMPVSVMLVLLLIITGSYVSYQLAGNRNIKTTRADTYIAAGALHFDRKDDQFLNKMVTSRRIPKNTSGSGGGGGHHMSAGGHSHGGGGGRH